MSEGRLAIKCTGGSPQGRSLWRKINPDSAASVYSSYSQSLSLEADWPPPVHIRTAIDQAAAMHHFRGASAAFAGAREMEAA